MPTDDTARQPPARVVVVGGGFSGTMTAVNLVRLGGVRLNLTVINEREPVGRGIAYRRRRPEYLLNVAARNMSAFPDDADHFLRWVSAQPQFEAVPQIDLRERFIPRQTYGDYLRALTQRHLTTGPVPARLVVGTAVDIEPGDFGCLVRLADGSAIEADRVVLATGTRHRRPCPAPRASPAIPPGSATRGRPGRNACPSGTRPSWCSERA